MKISAAESKVLDVLWRQGPSDTGETAAALEAEGWGEETVRTLLRRLIAKKAVAKTKDGKRAIFRALVEQADVAQTESETLVDRFFEGRLSPLVLQFSQRRKLEKDDLEELKRLIATIEKNDQ